MNKVQSAVFKLKIEAKDEKTYNCLKQKNVWNKYFLLKMKWGAILQER